jgi:hypothetical protein
VRVFAAERTWCCAGELAKDPGYVALVLKAQVNRNGAEWEIRVGQHCCCGAHPYAIQVLAQCFAKLLAENLSQIHRMHTGGTRNPGQSKVL